MRLAVRERLTGWFTAVLLLGLLLFGGLLLVFLERRLLSGTDARLQQRADNLQEVVRHADVLDEPLREEILEFGREQGDVILVEVRRRGGEQIVSPPPGFPSLPVGPTVEWNNHSYRSLSAKTSPLETTPPSPQRPRQ